MGEKREGWLRRLISGKPHFIIGGADDPYLLRWYLIPRNPFFNIYLHKFLRDDDDRALHDHPWWFVSLILKGGYSEVVGTVDWQGHRTERRIYRAAGNLVFRPATHRHRVVLWRDQVAYKPKPCWTLIVTGRKKRTWGFWCPKGFVPWFDFVAQDDEGNIGRGCE